MEADDLSWPRTVPPPLTHGELRATPEDFVVEELMPFALTGAGEHLWLKVCKRGFNSEQVAKQLARLAGVARRDVGYAGMKDRHAVTVQWFSLHLPGRDNPDFGGLPPAVEILEAVRHTRKLKTGGLGGNRFSIVLRECRGDRDALMRRVEDIRARGVPNYFGEQRFGRDGDNVDHARAMFAGTASPHDRKLRGIYFSAARSLLFNEVLARRVADGTWDRLLDGEAVMLDGRRSFFVAAVLDAELERRLAEGDIHPSGPLWGRGEVPACGPARTLELAVTQEYEDIRQGLERAGLEQERRALRVIPRDFGAEWLNEAVLRLRFSLPAGSYATVVLRELADYHNAAAAKI
ncbi:MAG: tRNA pseudouridine(13) synthase TruD [Pseudomonadota bacterium]